ncbi:MAG: outer membrane protein assembly factor BamB [Betaproteobacteria bacterium]|nr:outer membrane protein assembly factor BamB [Betaproteobacteria bacterium]
MLGISGCGLFGGNDKKPQPLPAIVSPDALTISWSASVGKSGGFLFSPAFGDKLIFAATNEGKVLALAEEGGRIVTKIDAKTPLTSGVGVADDIVVVAGGKGEVLAFDTAGRLLWKTPVNGEVLAPPAIASGTVIVRTTDGRILALGRIDGKRRWVFQRATPALTLRTNAGVTVSRGTIYAGYPGGKMLAIELDSGKPTWEASLSLPRGATELERIADVSGFPLLDDSRICGAVYQGRTGCLETLSGNVLWSREISSANGVSVDARLLYVTDVAGNVLALDKASGATVWKQEKLVNRDPGLPLAHKGKVLVGDAAGLVHILSTDDGNLIGRISTDGSRIRSLVSNGDRAIVQTDKGGIFALAVK